MGVLLQSDRLKFDPEHHKYTLDTGIPLVPVSSVLSSVEHKFEGKDIATKKVIPEILAELGISKIPVEDPLLYSRYGELLEEKVKNLMKSWSDIGQDSADEGNWIDKDITGTLNGLPYDIRLKNVIKAINEEHNYYYEEIGQLMVFSEKYGVSGTVDRVSLRPFRRGFVKGQDDYIVDLSDYKTAKRKKVVSFDSTYVKDGKRKSNRKFLYSPLSHLEQCSYTRYALQLSAYAFIIEEQYGFTIGRLKILFVYEDDNGEYQVMTIPVPYMRMEIQTLFERIPTSRELFKKATEEPKSMMDLYADMRKDGPVTTTGPIDITRFKYPLTPEECYHNSDILTMPASSEENIYDELSQADF